MRVLIRIIRIKANLSSTELSLLKNIENVSDSHCALLIRAVNTNNDFSYDIIINDCSTKIID